MHLIRLCRKQRGLTIGQLADMSKVTARLIHKIENDAGYNCTRHTMLKVSGALKLPVSMLFFPEEEMKKRAMLNKMYLYTIASLAQEGLINLPEDQMQEFITMAEDLEKEASTQSSLNAPSSST